MKKTCLIIGIIVLLLCDCVLGAVCWSCSRHEELPSMIHYSGRIAPISISINRMDDGVYIVAVSWKWRTLAFEQTGIHLYGG